MNAWLIMLAMGLVTYGVRLSWILAIGRLRMPPLLVRALRFVPAAVLSAIVFPELLRPAGVLDVSLNNVRLLAGVIAAIVARRTRSVIWTLVAGLVVLWLLQ